MKKVKHCTLDWRYLDTFYKVSNQVEIKSDYGYKIDIKQEEELTQEQKDFYIQKEAEARSEMDPEEMPLQSFIVCAFEEGESSLPF